MYEPEEDTYFLMNNIKTLVKSRKFRNVLEIGTGTGIISFNIAKYVEKILAVDINPEAVKLCEKNKKRFKFKNIEFRISNLFENIYEKSDLIFFNPPYLPVKEDLCWSGGKNGEEIIIKFLEKVASHLNKNGIAVILLSSFNDIKKLKHKYKLKLIDKKKLWFEELYCFKKEI
ncbi:MAG: hypothetical protein B6U88_02615 [Candidatus Aenigmarchaeota archaeon ex4484_56]|nr:MAG: hypothetical protein B6U88_02615 [Candidatus Aenigmarchaeota archaeon ex4484_56]